MSDDETRALEQEIRDERARRFHAERALAEQVDKTATWRRRAEERAEALARRTRRSRRWRFGRPPRTGRSRAVAPSGERVGAGPTSTLPPAFPTIRAVVAAGQGTALAAIAAEFDGVPLSSASVDVLADADIVLVDSSALTHLPDDELHRLTTWLEQRGRSPLLIWNTGASDHPRTRSLAEQANLVFTDEPGLGAMADGRTRPIEGLIDIRVHNPVDMTRPGPGPVEWTDATEYRIGVRGDTAIAITADPEKIEDLPDDILALVASGVPLGVDGEHPELLRLDPSDETSLARAGAAARRWAFGRYTTWRRAAEILDTLRIDVQQPEPEFCGLLVSNRPHLVTAAAERFAQGTYPRRRIIVGLHGPEASFRGAHAAFDSLAHRLPIEVLRFDSEVSLGECLNRCAERAPSGILAKIDDDDFYGPNYALDAVTAMRYSGSPLLGKGAHYAYLEANDSTVLMNAAREEQFLDGPPFGGSLVFRRGLWEELAFPHRPRRVDTVFVRGASAMGVKPYAPHRFEFLAVRRRDGHTWSADPGAFIARSVPAWDGLDPSRCWA